MGEKTVRIEVWFLNGTRQDDNVLRCFPHVSSFEENEKEYSITFGGGDNHTAIIQKRNVLFIEMMKEED